MKIIKFNLLIVAIGSALAAIATEELLLEVFFIASSLVCLRESSKL